MEQYNVLMDITTNYTYNSLNQLTKETETLNSIRLNDSITDLTHVVQKDYTYDVRGNMIEADKTITNTYHVYDESSGNYTDDVVVEDGGTETFSYNLWNQLVSYTDADNATTSYTYDGTNMRVSKTQGTNVRKYYWDRGYISNEYLNNTLNATNYISAGGIFARDENNSVNYMLKNAHGDTINLVSSSRVNKSYEYDPYGNPTYFYGYSSNDTNPIRYSGEYYDAESGLIYLRNRYYNPSVGRFINEDPIKDGLNWYAYCGGNPIAFFDPMGLAQVIAYYAFDSFTNTPISAIGTLEVYTDSFYNVTFSEISSEGKTTVTMDDYVEEIDAWYYNGKHVIDSGIFVYHFGVTHEKVMHNPGDAFDDRADAAMAWALTYNPISVKNDIEYSSAIYQKDNGKYYFTAPTEGDIDTSCWPYAPSGTTPVAAIHSHGAYNAKYKSEIFSGDDKRQALDKGMTLYLSTPGGKLKSYVIYSPKKAKVYGKTWIMSTNVPR